MVAKTNKDKWAHNLDRLVADKESEFIYVPVQYGKLSHRVRRVKLVDKLVIIRNNKPTVFKLYEIAQRNIGAGRKLVWFHRVIKKDRLGQVLEFDIMADNPNAWRGLKAIEKKQTEDGVIEKYKQEMEAGKESTPSSQSTRERREIREFLNRVGRRRESVPVKRKEVAKN